MILLIPFPGDTSCCLFSLSTPISGFRQKVEGVVRVGLRRVGRLLGLRVTSEHGQCGHAGFYQGGEGQERSPGCAFGGVDGEKQGYHQDCCQPSRVRLEAEGGRCG